MRFVKTLSMILVIVMQACTAGRHDAAITASCPEAVRILPDFPPFEDEEAFFNDSLLYERGKALRDTERGRQAVIDARIGLDFYLDRFGEAMGLKLSMQDSPAIAKYIEATCNYAVEGLLKAKDAFSRPRPFTHFGEPSSVPADEEKYGASSSYPSGHTMMAWIVALSLASIDEAHEYEIIRAGYELGQSRVISGFHYQSDVDAGRMAADAAYARVVSDPEYIRLMKRARKEVGALNRK